MCGICGTVGNTLPQHHLFAAMQAIAHRGPDHAGHIRRPQFSLGHQRLAILDLSEQGNQPMTNEDKSLWLVFNGEIYNFAELRTLLEPYHHFHSQTDTEVLVHGYEQWGIDGLLQRIQGMFAFALWDETRNILHLVRDRLGKKPLYYSCLNGGLSFASTLPALIELLGTTPEVSQAALLDYLTYLCVPAPHSIFEGVFKLPPACRLEFRPGYSPQLRRYWSPDFSQTEHLPEEEWLARLEGALHSAVRDRMIADVPVGAFLSGGLDSSFIVALMAAVAKQPIKTLSIGFPQSALNELPYAQHVARLLETDHTAQVLYPNAISVLPELVFHGGEPFADHSALPMYHLAKLARTHMKVVLTGDGGDELFAGYRHIPAVQAAQRLHRLPNVLKGSIAALLRRMEQSGYRQVRKFRWVAEIACGSHGNYVFDPVGGRTFRFHQRSLLSPAMQEWANHYKSDSLYDSLWQQLPLRDWADRAIAIDLLTLLPDDLLTKVDVTTMAHGVEARSPLLDHRVIALCCQIPARLKTKNGQSKYLLKRLAARYLPDEILNRPKQGFSLPTSEWLRDDLGSLLYSTLLSKAALNRDYFSSLNVAQLIHEHLQRQADHGQRLWALLVLELWFQLFIDKTLSPHDRITNDSHFALYA